MIYEYCVKVYSPDDKDRSLAEYQLEANALGLEGWEPILNAVFPSQTRDFRSPGPDYLVVTYRRALRPEQPKVQAVASAANTPTEQPEVTTDPDGTTYHFKL